VAPADGAAPSFRERGTKSLDPGRSPAEGAAEGSRREAPADDRRVSELRESRDGQAFREGSGIPVERERLLTTRIKDLALQIAGTRLERWIRDLYRELEAIGVFFQPTCYLSDEWGCPESRPLIGIPFYLADEKLYALEGEVSEGRETERESTMYLRHEAGHAFCYAYELYKREDFHALFGPYTRPYVDDFKVQPFSRSFVRHIPGWYAQKHPDEDFAETFAIFLTPGQSWREQYAGWPALRKLEYVEERIRELGRSPPTVSAQVPETPDVPVESIEEIVAEAFPREGPPQEVGLKLAEHLDGDLRSLFDAPEVFPTSAADLVEAGRSQLIRSVSYWTGLQRPVVKAIVLHLLSRTREMRLTVKTGGEAGALARFSVFVTTLAMNRMYSGKFLEL
jgi:hypothetical protein